jgi:type I restriction enzyme S subunit
MSFPRYPKYKHSGVEWLGDVPEGWDVKRFRFCVRSSNAGEVIDRSYWHSGDELFFSCQRDAMSSNFSEFPLWKRTSDRDLLVTRNATPYVHTPPANSIYSNVVQRCILNDGLLRSFVALSLETVCARLREDGYGVSIPSFSYEKWCNLHLALPPLPEQTAIAEFLDRETGKIDELVAEQRRLMELLKEKRQAVISHAVTKGLNPCAPMKPSGIEWLGDVPAGWEVAKTSFFFKVAMGQTILAEDLIENGEWPVFSATDGDHYFGRVNDPKVRLNVGDIIVPARGNSIGSVKLVKEPASTTQTTIYCKSLAPAKLHSNFVYQYFRGCKESLFYFTQTAIPQITTREVSSNPILIPPMSEQIAIVAFLETELLKFDTLTAEAQRAIELLQERRTALISAAVTGQIDVRQTPKN